MFTPKRLCASSLVILCLLCTALAQDQQSGNVTPKISQTNTTVTAAATTERVRFTAPGNVVRMQLQIISESGQILFDVSSKGNVLDWSLHDSTGQRLQGLYLTVVTVKSLSGRLSERIGTVSVAEKQVELKAVESLGLMPGQQQAVGPVEENSALTILKAGETDAATVVAHNGTDGEIVRSRGALSFRVGDFFSGNDQEQMRLTEEGNLGIGTSEPQAKLDVAGMIRARAGFLFSDGSTLNVNDKGALTLTNSNGNPVPNAAGSGTQDRLAKWTDNSGTLGDSVITESAGNIGIGISSPGASFEVQQPASPTVPNMYLSQAGTPSKSVFQFLKVGSNTWSYFGHNVQFNGTANVLLDPAKSGWAFYANGDVTDAFYVYSKPPTGGDNYPLVLKRDGRLKLSSGNFFAPGNNQLEVQVQNPAYAGAVIKAAASQSASLQEWQNSTGAVLSKFDSSGNLSVGTPTSPTGGVATFNGNVGIGTTTPGSKLTVAGVIESTSGGIRFPDGSSFTTAAGLRLEVNATSPNVVGGFAGNNVTAGVVGAAIGGGGTSGFTNRVTDTYGTVGGGVGNQAGDNAGTTADKLYATVGGGAFNTAIGQTSTVGGGWFNTAASDSSTIGGGQNNIASGVFSTVPGGFFNAAQGDFSFAAGRQAKANHQGAFVWADSTSADFISSGNNQFLIRAAGGVGIGTAAPAALLQVRDTPLNPGSATFFSGTGAMINSATNNGGSTPALPETVMVLAREGVGGQAFANFARFDLKRYENVGTGSRSQFDFRLSHGDLFSEANNTPVIMSLQSGGNVGIGTTAPNAKLHVAGGDAAITTQGFGVILKATDGANCFRVTVNNAGALSTAAVTCP